MGGGEEEKRGEERRREKVDRNRVLTATARGSHA